MNNTLHKLSFSYIFNFKKDKAFSVSTILSSLALILGISILITVMSADITVIKIEIPSINASDDKIVDTENALSFLKLNM